MIDEEILECIEYPSNDGARINDIADQFRRGRDAKELILLLDSDNIKLVYVGTWILKEISFELYNCEEIIARLRELMAHSDPAVRFEAEGALWPSLRLGDAATETLLARLLVHHDEAVRSSAEELRRALANKAGSG